MENLISFGWIFLLSSCFLSIVNIMILFYLTSSFKKEVSKFNTSLAIREANIFQHQVAILESKINMNSRRIESVEKIVTVMLSTGPGGSDDGMTH
jgi:hypothetical protein